VGAVAGRASVNRKRFVKITGGDKTVNRDLETKARALAGIKGYVTNLTDQPAEFVIDAYHRLIEAEKSFRMSKSDLRARPTYARLRDSTDAHLQVVIAAVAVSRRIEETTGWSIRRFVRTLRLYRNATVTIGELDIEAAVPLEPDAAGIVEAVKPRAAAEHYPEPTRVSPIDRTAGEANASGGG